MSTRTRHRARRAKAEEKHILAGKTVLRALIERLGKLDLTLKQWFDLMDDSGAAKSDATVTTRELKAGLAKVKATRGVLLLSLDEMNTLLRYIDTTGDGDLSYLEVQQAVAKLDVPTACMAKYMVTELQGEVVDKCLQFHGGAGFINDYPIARMFRDSRITRIFGGSNEVMKMVIARSM